jgi:hypothetical protein
MSRARQVLPVAVLLLAGLSGCTTARLIESTPEGGVIAIPSNSNYWPMKYRDSAEKLMAQKCPNGYDIVYEKEVVVGQKTSTSELTDTAPGGDPTMQKTRVVTTTRPETEYRIAFRNHRQPASAAPPAQITTAARPTPVVEPVSATTPGLGIPLPPRPIPVTGP